MEYNIFIKEVNKMERIKEALWEDYEETKKLLEDLEPGTDEYKMVSAEGDNIRKELIDVGKTDIESDIKKTQIEEDTKREKTKNRITIGTFTVTTGLSLYALLRTFKFDETDTVTSTLGRNILNSFLPKKK